MKLISLILIVISFPMALGQDMPELLPGEKIKANGEVINVKIGHLAPCVTDWNNDGKKDLVVGLFKEGKIRLYLNHGTDDKPVFKDFENIKAGGKDIRMKSG